MRVEMPRVVPSATSIKSPAQIITALSAMGQEQDPGWGMTLLGVASN